MHTRMFQQQMWIIVRHRSTTGDHSVCKRVHTSRTSCVGKAWSTGHTNILYRHTRASIQTPDVTDPQQPKQQTKWMCKAEALGFQNAHTRCFLAHSCVLQTCSGSGLSSLPMKIPMRTPTESAYGEQPSDRFIAAAPPSSKRVDSREDTRDRRALWQRCGSPLSPVPPFTWTSAILHVFAPQTEEMTGRRTGVQQY